MESSSPKTNETRKPLRSPRRILLGVGLLSIAVLGAILFYNDGMKVLQAAASISWVRFALPVGATLLSYGLMALSYEGIAAAAGTPLGLRAMLRITFVSNTVNYLVATGGLSGFAARMYFFRRRDIALGQAVTISFVQGLLTNLALMLFLILGFAFLVRDGSLGHAGLLATGSLLGFFILILFLCVLLLVSPNLRRPILKSVGDLAMRGARRWLSPAKTPSTADIAEFRQKVDDGFQFLLTHWTRMLLPTVYILLDWVATLAVLWGCFWAVDLWIPPALVTVGFSVAILSSMVSITPGGLGIMESVTAALYASLGVPLAPTLVAMILFRLSYYALPFLVSLVFFRGMLFDAKTNSR